MQRLGNWWRPRRGEVNWLVFAAVLTLLVLPAVGQAATLTAPMQAQSCEAILMWLQSDAATAKASRVDTKESLLALTNRHPGGVSQVRHAVPPAVLSLPPEGGPRALDLSLSPLSPTPWPRLLEFHEASHRTGIRTNRRLN